MLSPDGSQPDGLAVVDVDTKSATYGQIVHSLFMPNTGEEIHHFGWSACSPALSPLTGHAFLERRRAAMPAALAALAGGHFLAKTAILLPFSLMTTLVVWERAAGLVGSAVWLTHADRACSCDKPDRIVAPNPCCG